MTSPFPTQFGGQTIAGPGVGNAMAGGLADVLASMQQQRENQHRMMELQNQMAQQQALQQYYEAQARLQQEQENRLAGESLLERQTRAQSGQAQRAALMGGQPGVFQPGQTTTPSSPTQMPGQAQMGAGAPTPPPPNLFQEILGGGAQAIGGQAGYQRIFQGVEDENMTSAVKAVQEAQALQPKPPELPNSAKELLFLQSLSPEQQQKYWQMVGPKPAPTTNINLPAGETAFSKQYNENAANQLSDVEKQAATQGQGFPSLLEAYKLVGKSFTGFGANQVVGLGRAVNALGGNFKVSGKSVEDTQTLLKLTREQTLSYLQTRALGTGTAVSDQDRIFMERMSGADITLEPTTIKRIIRINVGTGIMRMTDAIQALQEAALQNPAEAPKLRAKAFNIQKKLDPIWAEYAKMIKAEAEMDDINPNAIRQQILDAARAGGAVR
jgi:hypothetical protein